MNEEEKIRVIEEELKKVKYNKATEHHIGLLKAKLAKLRSSIEEKRRRGPATSGYNIRKSGDATAIIVGFPSVGKSTFLNAITDAQSKTAPYAFTTLSVIPGTLYYKGAKIQILDVPGIVEGAAIGRGRGREVLNTARNADLIILMADIRNPEHFEILIKEVESTNIRINKERPDVVIAKTQRGGLKVSTTVKLTKIQMETVKAILSEFRIINAEVTIRQDIDQDELIDAIEKNRVYIPAVFVFNKIDIATDEQIKRARDMYPNAIFISGEQGIGLDEIKKAIFDKLEFIRVFTKEVNKKADMKEPLIVRRGTTVEGVCRKLHRDFITKFKFCRVYGKSAKFPGQKFMLNHKLEDGDIVEIHTK